MDKFSIKETSEIINTTDGVEQLLTKVNGLMELNVVMENSLLILKKEIKKSLNMRGFGKMVNLMD